MSPQLKLSVGAAVMAAATLYLAYLGASASWQYYVIVDECVTARDELVGHRLRVSGRVAEGSLQIPTDRSQAVFTLAGNQAELAVTCQGPLPDNLAERLDVIVEGRLQPDGRFAGDKVLTRCASKYEAAKAAPAGVMARRP